jgi:hypothetical protein
VRELHAGSSVSEGVVIGHNARANDDLRCGICGAQFCYHGLNAVISHNDEWHAEYEISAPCSVCGARFPQLHDNRLHAKRRAQRQRENEQPVRVRVAWWVAAICGALGLWFLLLAALSK